MVIVSSVSSASTTFTANCAIAYEGSSSYGIVKTVSVASDGQIEVRVVDPYALIEEHVEAEKRTLAFMKRNAAANKPFYIAYWPQLASFMGISPDDKPRTAAHA